MKPPAVVLTDGGAEVHFGGVRQCGIEWSQVREIAVEVLVLADAGYSEALWKLTRPGVEFGASVEVVVGADEFNECLFAFPGFDHAAYQRAREAEEKAKPGLYVCWRA